MKKRGVNMAKKKDNNVKMNFSSKSISIILTIIGILLILITSLEISDDATVFLKVIISAGNSIGLTLLSVGLVSILIEISTIDSVVNKAIKTVLSDEIPLESYSDSFLSRLKNKISAELTGISINNLQKSVYILEPNLLDLTNSLYYEYHKAQCDVIPDKSKQIFLKKFKIEYKIINENGFDNWVKLGLSLYDIKPNMSNEERLNNVKIKKFFVNDTNLIDDPLVERSIIPTDVDDLYEYDYTYIFKRQLQKCREHKVVLEYEYTTTQNDLTQSWKLKYPCKKIEHSVTIKGKNDWRLKANAFASFYHTDSKLQNFFKVEQTIDKSAKIEFDKWTIPGAGYVISYNDR